MSHHLCLTLFVCSYGLFHKYLRRFWQNCCKNDLRVLAFLVFAWYACTVRVERAHTFVRLVRVSRQ